MLRFLTVLTLLSLTTAACSTEAPPEEVDEAADVFFQRLKEANYDSIYDESARAFRDQNARATVLDNLMKVREYGGVNEWYKLSMRLENEGRYRVALPVYSVRFDSVRCEVTFKFTDDGGRWKLLGFAVRPFGASQ